MRKIMGLIMVAVLCGMLNLQASEQMGEKIIPRYTVYRTTDKITIDGKLTEKAWQSAPSLSFIFPWPDQPGKKQKTEVKMLWDNVNLYVAYVCEDEDITAKYTQRDDPTYKDDCVEIFINPNPALSDCYYGLEMNALGTLYDYFMVPKVSLIKEVDLKGVSIKTFLPGMPNKGWILECAIPFESLYHLSVRDNLYGKQVFTPRQGSSWRINLNRWDGKEKRALSQWSPSDATWPDPHTPDCFGIITFSGNQD